MAVGSWVPLAVVDAVENSQHPRVPGSDHAVEAVAVFGRPNLTRVFLADGSDCVGKNNSPFKEIDPTEEFEVGRRKISRLQIEQRPKRCRKNSLISDVVNCEEGFALLQTRVEGSMGLLQ